jgi:hypothetical protein
MKKKLTLIVTASMVIAGMILNMRLNTQKTNVDVLLFNIEALTSELTPEEEEILLHGSLAATPFRSYSQPLSAIKHSSHITVAYLTSLNNITVQIVNSTGQTVYSNNVNPVAGGQLYISLAGLSSGDYTLVFLAPNGNSIYGDFEI